MSEASASYDKIAKDADLFFKPYDLKFKILSGPIDRSPPILFLGYQPGGEGEDAIQGRIEECELGTKGWKLAEKIKPIFNDNDFLKKCVATNAIFAHAKNIKNYSSVSIKSRREVEEFCLPRVCELIKLIQPKKIIVIGFKTLDLFGGGEVDLISKGSSRRILTKKGSVTGQEALATLHLSGARISKVDRELIHNHIRQYIG